MIGKIRIMTDFNENGCDDLELLDGMCDSVTAASFLEGYSDFYKETEESKIWWIDKMDSIGEHLLSFDRKKIYNLFEDYPYNMTEEEVEIFDRFFLRQKIISNPFILGFLEIGLIENRGI